MLMACLSPENVHPRAQVAIDSCPIIDIRRVLVEECDGALVLSGSVSSFYHKQLAQEIVWALCKNLEIELINRVRVQ